MNGTQVIQTELISYRINHRKALFPAAVVGIGTLLLAAILGLVVGGWANFLHAYLAAYLFWFGITVGCIALTMLHHLTGGRWGDVIRPFLETGMKGLPLMFLLFIPILLGMKLIYPWTQPDQFLTHVLKHQHDRWLNPTFFVVRFVIYFGIFFALAQGLLRKYKLRDEMAMQDPAHNSGPSFRTLSGPGLVLLCVTITLATADWAMSTQAGWYSTIYGLGYLAGQGLSTFAFMVVVALIILRQYDAQHGHREGSHHSLIATADWHDLGNLLLTFTMLWGYMSLSQLLITYSGNLPQETVFYHDRSLNGWQYVGGFLIALHWALPFTLLLMRDIKKDPKKLVWVAVFILLVRQLDFYYQIHPAYTDGLRNAAGEVTTQVNAAFGWHTVLNLLTPIGIGGIWIAFFAWNLRDRRVLPAPAREDHHG
jgi:hypothetical protein